MLTDFLVLSLITTFYYIRARYDRTNSSKSSAFSFNDPFDTPSDFYIEERDYNHATDVEYEKFRKLADQAYQKRSKLSSQSQQAYKSGDKAKAHELSTQAKEQLAIAEQYNRKAAEYVFIQNNLDSDNNDIDLHGLYVKEAEYILKQRIINGIRRGEPKLECIVGKGLHSKNGVAKLKPAIEQLCDEANITNYIDKKNSGVLIIDIRNARIPDSWSDINPDGIGAMTEHQTGVQQPYGQQQQPQYQSGGQQQHQQQQQQQQHHQQQQQQNNNNDETVQLITVIVKALCACFK
ncbi:unnamed protein product [Ambrosiozyma monospora]|uniref:Unnamed protein product n=1 Tax=Ambrosiozyma monospora TaxID=43982 RepID=A0A9W7DIC2_AMBMO|nr:unnamed protein product [Ambrosiozyma monospora]